MAGTIRMQEVNSLECSFCLNGVRPRWPEQLILKPELFSGNRLVSMESGLDGRNNEV